MRAKLLVLGLALAVLLSSGSVAGAAPSGRDYVKYVKQVVENAGIGDSELENMIIMPLEKLVEPRHTPRAVIRPPSPTNPDFTISISPSSQSVTRGQSTSYTIRVASVDGYEGMISLSLSGLPRNSTGSLGPSSVSLSSGGSATSTLRVTTSGSTATGTHTLTVTGTGSRTKSATASLTVQQPVAPTPPRVNVVSMSLGPPSLKAYDRGSPYDPYVINYYDMVATGWDSSKAAANVWARAGGSSPIPKPTTTPPPASTTPKPTTSIPTLSLSPKPVAPLTNIASAVTSAVKAIVSTLLPLRLF